MTHAYDMSHQMKMNEYVGQTEKKRKCQIKVVVFLFLGVVVRGSVGLANIFSFVCVVWYDHVRNLIVIVIVVRVDVGFLVRH